MSSDQLPANVIDFDIDIFGQQPSLNLYTQLCFCFRLAKEHPTEEIIQILQSGLDRLTRSAPWIAGNVVNSAAKEGESEYKIRYGEKKLEIITAYHATPTFDELEEAGYPASLLNERAFASRLTFPNPDKPGIPVFEVQASFIPNGLILTIVGQHQTMDMTGQEFIMQMFSKACGNQSFSVAEEELMNMPRKNIISLHESLDGNDGSARFRVQAPSSQDKDESLSNQDATVFEKKPPALSWVFFNFSARCLKVLKDDASSTLSTGYISRDDALTALVWQSLVRARTSRLPSDTPSKFGRAVDSRRYLGCSKTYPGLLQCMSHHSRTFERLTKESLGSIAAEFRYAVDPKTTKLAEDTRDLARAISQAKDRSTLNVIGTFDPSTGLMLSSWASVEGYSLDFGLGLGCPKMVRRPSFTNVEGLAYLMPKTPEGDISLMICARDDDLERLREDSAFKKYATYIG